AQSTLPVAGSGTLTDVNVTLNIVHTYDGDLTLSLVHPNTTTRVNLSNRNGSGGDNYHNTTFDDEAAIHITGGSPPYSGSYRPVCGRLRARREPGRLRRSHGQRHLEARGRGLGQRRYGDADLVVARAPDERAARMQHVLEPHRGRSHESGVDRGEQDGSRMDS